ncbi:hypothetical protein GCM10028807_40560 [Spirosoma daeguense]
MSEFSPEPYPFLQDGGEMGELTRTYDWSKTALGTPDQWPRSLQTTLGLILHSAFPMFLFWGSDLLCFYNDAYRPSLGTNGKHPALGKSAKTVWPETWDFIGPIIKQVMATGQPVWYEDQLVPIYRNGKLEDVYWTFSYSPAYDDAGQIAGVFVTCTETTSIVISQQRLQESEQRFRTMIDQTPVAMAVFRGSDHIIEMANEAYQQLVGRKANDLLGKPMFDAMPEIKGYGYEELLANVLATGQPYYALELSAPLLRKGQMEKVYLNFTYHPLRSEDGSIIGVTVVANEITDQVIARQKIEESEAELTFAINAAELGVWDLDPLTNRFKGNARLKDWFGLRPHEEIPLTLALQTIADKDRQRVADAIEHALRFESGGVYDSEYSIIHPHTGQERRVRAKGKTQFSSDQTALRLNGTLQDITDQKRAEEFLRASEAKFRTLIQEAPMATMLMVGPNHTIEIANETMVQMLGKGSSLVGQPATAAVPELASQRYLQLLDKVYSSGVAHEAKAMPGELWADGIASIHYFDFTYKPVRNQTGEVYGIISMAVDVTEQVLSRQALEESTNQMRSMVESAPFPIGVYIGREMRIQFANQAIIDVYGKGNDVIGKLYTEILPELATQEIFEQLRAVYDTGIPFDSGTRRVDIEHNGALVPYYFNYNFTPLFDASGKVYGVMNTAADVTPLETARQTIQENESTLRNAIELAELGTWKMDVATGQMTYSERMQSWLGVQGAVLGKEASPRVHPKDRERIKLALDKSLEKSGTGRYDEIYTITHAITGQERIIHANGQVLFDNDGNALSLSGTAQDVTIQQELKLALEYEVQNRTEELASTNEELASTNEELAAINEELSASNEEYEALNEELQEANELLSRSNENLQTFAYVASHDLQEPLRKIQQFGDLLKTQLADSTTDQLNYLERMQSAARRMSMLIKDLLNFSRISTRPDESRLLSLDDVLRSVLTDLELVISETGAQIHVDPLPKISGDSSQLGQLFQNLLSNALKFSRVNTSGNPAIPQITVRHQLVDAGDLPSIIKSNRSSAQFHQIDVTDNGIGFDEKYLDRIFQVFQRLHGRSEFAGTGIGLAICEKVVTNHGGAISATSKPGQGATFSVYLPA